MEFAFFNKLIVFLISAIAIWIGGLVYLNNPREKINRIFVSMVILMLFWVNFAFFARLIGRDSIELSSLFLRIAWFVTPPFFVLLYFLVIYLINKTKEYQLLSKAVLVLGGVVTFFTGFTGLIIEGIKFVDENLTITYGVGMFPFLGVIFFLIIATLYPLIKRYLKSPLEERGKIEYFMIGIFIFYLGNFVFNITFPIFLGIARFYYIGDYSAIFLIGSAGYAIVARELFGIRVILTQTLVGVIAILLLWQAVIAIPDWFEFTWKFILFLIFIYFGYLLIKSVIQEIRRRAELQKLYVELEKLDEAKTEFMSIVSHQLRTPLTAIKGYTSMILEGIYGKLPEKMQKPVDNVLISSERLIRFVNDILNVTRIETGRLEFIPESTAMEEIISSVIFELDIKAKEKNLYLKWEKPKEPLPKIMIDPDKTRQIILNFIDNAIKYTNEGGVTVEVGSTKSEVKIKISDTGVGMSKEDITKLFKSFSRGESGVTYYKEGTGLGLYIARQFVEMQEGRTWAESPGKGKGSTFYIELPIR